MAQNCEHSYSKSMEHVYPRKCMKCGDTEIISKTDYIVHDDKNIKGFFGEYRYLSNFHVCDVYFEGMKYKSSEAAYMAAKTLDLELRKQFQGDLNPADAKKLGRTIKLRTDWSNVKYDIMCSIVFDKFYRNIDLREKLVSTGGVYIEETNHWKDQTWGVCNGVGTNWLGIILMKTRAFWSVSHL